MYFMRSFVLFCLVLSLLLHKVEAQVQRYNATAENNYGVVYTLPKTQYVVSLTVLKKHFTPGMLAPWAVKYLGREAGQEPLDEYEFLDVRASAVGIPDTTKRYLVAFDKRSVAPFLALTPRGTIYSINGKEIPPQDSVFTAPAYPIPDRVMPALTQEYMLATSKYKRAEIVADYIYQLREHTMNIVSGEVEQMPKDGESMRLILDKLKTEEQRCLRLFQGDTTYTVERHDFVITPEQDDMYGRILCRFSTAWGLVAEDDLSGDPLYIDIKILERSPELRAKEQTKRQRLEGIVYNLPGTAELKLRLEEQELIKVRLPMTQVGTTQSLSKRMLTLKEAGTTAVYFDPHSGALLRIVNE